jgi:hypothetical protein
MVGEQHQRAIEVADRALAAAERGDLVALVADTLVTRGSALCNLGRSYEGVGAVRTGIDLAQANGLAQVTVTGLSNLSWFLIDSDVRGSFDAARAAEALAARLGDRAGAVGLLNATQAAMDVGEWEWALGQCTAFMETEPEDVERAMLTYSRLMIGSLRGEDPSEEAAWLEQYFGASDAEMLRETIPEMRFWVALGAGRVPDACEAAMAYGHMRPAEASYIYFYAGVCALWERDGERAAAALDALDSTGVHGRVVDMDRRTIGAGLAALDGRPGDALSAFREALAGWRDLGAPWREALTAITMATLLDPATPEVRAAADDAREILVRLGAAPFVARLDAAMSRPRDRAGHSAAAEAAFVTSL